MGGNHPSGVYREVTFVSQSGDITLRLHSPSFSFICRAARDLKARYFVTIEEIDVLTLLPIWGVYDMRTARRNDPIPGEWSINNPVKTFIAEKPDAAVMWAVMRKDAQ